MCTRGSIVHVFSPRFNTQTSFHLELFSTELGNCNHKQFEQVSMEDGLNNLVLKTVWQSTMLWNICNESKKRKIRQKPINYLQIMKSLHFYMYSGEINVFLGTDMSSHSSTTNCKVVLWIRYHWYQRYLQAFDFFLCQTFWYSKYIYKALKWMHGY